MSFGGRQVEWERGRRLSDCQGAWRESPMRRRCKLPTYLGMERDEVADL